MTFVKNLLTERVLGARPRRVMRGLALLLGICGSVLLSSDAFGQVRGLDHEDIEGVAAARHGSSSPVDAVPDGLTAADWSSIRQAYEAGRHAAHAVEGGYRARNAGQQWQTHFDGRAFTTRPDAGGWSWGLELQRYGFAGQERAVTLPTHVSAEGPRVAYDWDGTLTEWYVNDTRGLEHGFTVHQRPSVDGQLEKQGLLTFTIAVRGELVPEVTADGRGVRFVDGNGAAVLTYSGLTVVDAGGHALSARFERIAEGLSLTIDERGAQYPLTIDPIAQQAYLKASNPDYWAYFGFSVAVSGDTVVVGTPFEEGWRGSGPHDTHWAGAAYVFVRNGTTWSPQAYLKASNTEAHDFFGVSVAVSGDTLVVGAHWEDSSATGVNGDQSSNQAGDAGAAYVFVRNGTSWSQQAYLKASNTGGGDGFGVSVALSGDTVVVGAGRERSSATGVNGDQGDNSAESAGAAYVFVRDGKSWSQQAYLKASNTDAGDSFGGMTYLDDRVFGGVAVSGDTVVVTAPYEESSATGVNGDQIDNSADSAGAAYVFVRNGASWNQQAYLKASNTGAGDVFGGSVDVSGDTLVVGATGESSSATGVNGDQSDNSAALSGAAYVFVRNGTSWNQQAYLKASNTSAGAPPHGAGDRFGGSVAVLGDALVVGAFYEDSIATGVDGDQSDNSGTNAGAAYVFVRSGTSWSQQAYLKASNTHTWSWDQFGISVAMWGDTVVVGAIGESSGASGVNGNQSSNSVEASGAAYVFDLVAWGDQGSVLAGISGDPLLVGSGDLSDGSTNVFDLSNAAPDSPAALFLAFASQPVTFKGGTLMPFPIALTAFSTTSPTGTIAGSFVMCPFPAGTEIWMQWAIKDDAAIFGVALSNAILGVTP